MERRNRRFCGQWVEILLLCIILQGVFFPGMCPERRAEPQSTFSGIYLPLGLLCPAPAQAEEPLAAAGEYGPFLKNQAVGSEVNLDGSQSSHDEGTALHFEWFGPFPNATGPNPAVFVPEGTYTISLSVNDGISRSEIDEAVITVEPCFDVIVRAKRDVAQPYWQHITGAERYDVYRTDEDDPFSFVKVAEIDPAYTTYYDTSVQNEKTYLYVIGALVEGTWCFSAVESAHPTAVRTMGTVNYAPVIYTSPVTNGTAGIMYNFTIKAADPNCDPLLYTLTSSPPGMWIDQSSGQITWLPDAAGEYHVTVLVHDGKGGTDILSWEIEVEVRQPGQQRRPLAYILNTWENDVSVIDIQECAVIDRVQVGYGLYGIAVSPDGDRVYVTSTESGISIIDAATHILTGQIPVYADTLAVSPDGSLLYAVSQWEETLYRIDISSREVTGVMDTGPIPQGIAINNEGTRIYITSLVDGTVKVIDSSTMSIITAIRLTDREDSIWDVEVSNDGSKVYAVSARSCRLSVIDSETNLVIQTKEYLGGMKALECYIALSPDGHRIALSDISSANEPKTIFIIDSRSLDVLNVFPATWPTDLDFTADGSHLCVPEAWFHKVFIFNEMNSLAGTIEQNLERPCAVGHFIAEHKERISGRALADGEGVEGVKVTLSNGRITKCFSTDALGRYFFYVPAGQYNISFPEGECLVSDQNLDLRVGDTEVVVPDVEVIVSARIWSEPHAVVSGQPVVLRWNTIKADSVFIDHGIGGVGPGGSLTVYPDETTTYTVTAAGSQGRTVTDRVTITVFQPPEVHITAEPQAVIQGEETTLSWTSSDADTLRLEFEDYSFPVEPAGTLTDIPQKTCTVTITATGPGGTATDSVTITVYVPPTMTIVADPAAIYAGQSTTLSWTSSDAESVSIDNGIGQVELNGSLTVSPRQATTYSATATGPGGVRTASATVTVNSVIGINIDSPVSGAAVNRPDILVRGTVSNACGNEIGITINGMPAVVHQGRFFANHVPLVDGENIITVHAEDIQGNLLDRSILVTADTTQPCITLSSIDTFGIAPLDTILRVDSLFTPDGLTFTDTGPGIIQYLAGDEVYERTAGISSPGVYYITARAYYEGSVFTDTIGMMIYDRNALDAMLGQKWEAMRAALLSNDIEAAVEGISSRTQSNYQDIFTSLTPGHRADLAAELDDIEIINIRGASVEYDIRTTRDGRLCSFLLLFELDKDGRWKIASF